MISDTGKRMRALLFTIAALCGQASAEDDVVRALELEPYPLPAAMPGRILIRDATVWTLEADGILENTDVFIEEGRIDRIGQGLAAPRDTLVIDAAGKHVTPGIVDAHSHAATEDLNVNEGVNSISAEVRIRDILDPRSLDIYRLLSGGVTTIHVLHGSGNTIGGQNAIIKLRWGAQTPDDLLFEDAPPTIKFALGENPKQAAFNRGPMRGRDGDLRYPATRMGVAALVSASFERAAEYQAEWQRYESLSPRQKRRQAPPRRDLQLEALVEVLDGERRVHSHAYRADEIVMLMRVAEANDFSVETFHHVLEGYKVADEMAAHGAGGSTFSDWWSYKMEAYDAIPYNAALMQQRGVLSSLNSDDSNLARRLNLEAAKTLRYGGLGREEALALVTLNPARQLQIDDRVGSLATGKDADVVIWSGDPLSVYSVAETTFVDGRIRFNAKADAAHRARVAAARETLIAAVRGDAESTTAPESKADEAEANPPAPRASYRFSPHAPEQATAIVGATVHTMTGTTIEDGVVVFAGGRIVAVGGAETQVPGGAERIDAHGKHLWPGVIHANTVLGISEIDTVAGSVDVVETGDVNANVDVSIAVNAASRHFPVARSGGITHAVVLPRGGMVAGTTSVIRTDGWTWEEMAAARNQSLVVRWPDAIPARYARLLGPPKTLADRKKESEELVDALDELMDAAVAYGSAFRQAGPGARPARYDPQLDALQPVVSGARPLWVSVADKHAIEAAVEWALGRGLRLVLLGARDAYLVTDLLARHRIPVVLPAVAGEPPREDDPYNVLQSLPARLEAAGVPFAIASSTRSGGSSNARNVTLFAGIAAAHGLDRESAYRSVTLYPARILGLDHVLGSIEPGKSASLLVTDGDLLEPGTNIEQVWIDGVRPSMDDVHKAAYRKWSARPKPQAIQ